MPMLPAGGAARWSTKWLQRTSCKARSTSYGPCLILDSGANTPCDLLPFGVVGIGGALPDHTARCKQPVALVARHDVEVNMWDALAHHIVLGNEASFCAHTLHDAG